MLFSINPNIIAAQDAVVDNTIGVSGATATGGLDINELAANLEVSPILSPETMINHILGEVNQAENKVVDSVAVMMEDPLNPASSVKLQQDFVEYTTNLTIMSKCTKLAGDFIKETTHIQ